MKVRYYYIVLISLLLWLPEVTLTFSAQNKPKTLKELIAEEKAQKEEIGRAHV